MFLKCLDLNKTYRDDIKNLNRGNVKKIEDLKQLGKIDDKYLIFSPLLGRIYLLDDETKKALDNDFFEEFLIEGLLVDKNNNFFPEANLDTDHLNIFLTTRCNLRCRYCYASGGETNQTINFDFVKKGIEKMMKNGNLAYLTFHGGGEPTLEFNLMRKIIMMTKNKSDDLKLHIQTNGIFSNKILNWLIDNNIEIGLSADGPPYIQDNQRPLVGNRKSSKILEKTIKVLVEANHNFGVRSTISAFSVDKQDEIVEYFYNLGVKELGFEPLFHIGRSLKDNSTYSSPPKLSLFEENFLKAVEFAEDCGIYLESTFNATRGPKCFFCGASGKNFSLTTDGYVTSCHDIPFGNTKIKEFIYGKFNKKSKNIEIFKGKLENLNKRIVQNMVDCQTCFLKWNCAGGCHAKTLFSTGNMFKPPKIRCNARRNITKKYYTYLARKKLLDEKLKIIHGNKIILKGLLNQTELQKIKNYDKLDHNSYITIDLDNANLKKLSQKINRAKEKNKYKPIFFIFNFNLKEGDLNIANGKKIEEFLKELNEHKVHYKITRSLPLCLFEHDHNNLAKELKIPSEVNESILDSNAKCERFRKCNSCIYLIRGMCNL